MANSVTWHGHSTFTLQLEGSRIVVDPFLSPNNSTAVKSAADLQADFILQTHGHEDHIADMLPLAQATGALVIANFEICAWVRGHGHQNSHALYHSGGHDFAFGRVKMTQALHGSGLPDGSYGGNPGGFVVSSGGQNIYVSGDTGLFSDMQLIGEEDIDLAILCVGDNYTMGPEDSIRAINWVRARRVIPCHYNTWPEIEIDVDKWADMVRQETDAEPVVLAVEENYQI